MDDIHVINEVAEKCAEYNKPLYMTFIDCEKAFDSVNTTAVVDALKEQGIGETYLRLLDDIYDECTVRIILHKQSDKFPIRTAVRQGDTILTNLFTAVLGSVFRKLDWEHLGFRINGEYLSRLRFADDIVLVILHNFKKGLRSYNQRVSSWG